LDPVAEIRRIAREHGITLTIHPPKKTKTGRNRWHEGTFYRRPQDGLWLGRMRYNGTRYQVSSKDEETCRRKLRALRVELENAAKRVGPPLELGPDGREYVRLASPAFRRWIYERDAGVCGLCAKPVPFEEMHVDHIRPRIDGGNDRVDNLRITHPRCNHRRGGARRRLLPA